MKRYFVTFADSRMKKSLRRIYKQAVAMGVYDRISINNEFSLNSDFRERFKEYLKPGVKGYGYWCWKPQIVLQTLEEMDEGDILQYSDAGCHLNSKGIERLQEYFQMAAESPAGVLAFQAKPMNPEEDPDFNLPDFKYTKGDLLDYFRVRKRTELLESGTIGATVIFFRKCSESINFVYRWREPYYKDFCLLDDSPSVSPNLKSFISHRHDQSIFSILCKLNHVPTVSAFEYWYPRQKRNGWKPDWKRIEFYPIWAKRDKGWNVFRRAGLKFNGLVRSIQILKNQTD